MAKAKVVVDPALLAAVMAAMSAVSETGGTVEGATKKLKAQGKRTTAERPEVLIDCDDDGLVTASVQLSDWFGRETEKGNVSVAFDKVSFRHGSHSFEVKMTVLRKADEYDEPYSG